MGVLASVVRITRARSASDDDGSVLKARSTDEHQALQHAERKVRTYRKAVLGLAGLLLLSLCGNLASAALTILVFKESRRSADAIPQQLVVLTDSKAAAPVGTSLPTSVKDTPDPSPFSVPGLKRCAVAPSGAEACWELVDPAMTAIPDGLQGNVAALHPADRIVPPQWLPVLCAGYQPRGLKVLLVLASTPLCRQTCTPRFRDAPLVRH